MRRIAILGMLAIVTVLPGLSRAEDWPKWLGPNGDGISKEPLPDQFPREMKQLWKQPVGIGYSSPVVAENRIYLYSLAEPNDRLSCFDADSGKVIWQQDNKGGYSGDFPGTRCTPHVQAGRVYTFGGDGQLVCRQVEDGKELWNTSVLKETGAKNLNWGLASNPLFVGDMIYVQNGRGDGVPVAVGIDKNSGKIVWKSQAAGTPSGGIRKWPQGGGYAQIILVDVQGTKQLIVFASDTLYGIAPADGKTIWSEKWVTDWDVNAANPLYRDGNLFLTSNYGQGCMMLKLSPTGATKQWQNKEIMSRFQPVILDGDVMYGNSEGTIKCLSWPDGAVKWAARQPRIGFGGSLVRDGDKLVAMSDGGELFLLRATPDGVQSLGQTRVFPGERQIWATPLIYKGRIYAKGTDSLVCLEMK